MTCFDKGKKRVQHVLEKRDKLGVLEALLYQQEHSTNPDLDYIKDLKGRIGEVRTQLAVMSQ